jgi:dTDP-4-dehydrorhamnose reductase
MRVLVTGANGFIGRHWIEQLLRFGASPIATGRRRNAIDWEGLCPYQTLDITDRDAVRACIQLEKPDAILHAAAISKPDQCELDHELAYRVNVLATQHLLEAAADQGCFFCFISTDFVFDGERGLYGEADETAPVNYYGHTKLLAEALIMEYPHKWCIARTVSVYGPPVLGSANLISIVVDKLQRGETYSVVDDQIRTPTYAGDLAAGVAKLIVTETEGLYHLSGEEALTPYQMAIATAKHMGLDPDLINRVTAATFQQPAKRPPRTGFVIEKAKVAIGFSPCSFEEGLNQCFPR